MEKETYQIIGAACIAVPIVLEAAMFAMSGWKFGAINWYMTVAGVVSLATGAYLVIMPPELRVEQPAEV